MKLTAMLSNTAMGTDWGFIRDAVVGLEESGLDGVSVNDHVVGGHPDRVAGQKVHTHAVAVHEPLVMLSFIAAVTSRLELATAILILPQRQTTLVAKQVAQIDLLSGGRMRLGVGVGRNWMEYEALGEDFSNRGRRIEEQVEVLRRFWSQDLVTFSGAWHQLDRVGLNPTSVQRPVPVWMGSFVGGTTDKVRDRIARLADGWLPQSSPEVLAPELARVRQMVEGHGRDPSSLGVEPTMRLSPSDDAGAWVASAEAYAALGVTHLKAATTEGEPAQRLELMLRWLEAVGHLRELR